MVAISFLSIDLVPVEINFPCTKKWEWLKEITGSQKAQASFDPVQFRAVVETPYTDSSWPCQTNESAQCSVRRKQDVITMGYCISSIQFLPVVTLVTKKFPCTDTKDVPPFQWVFLCQFVVRPSVRQFDVKNFFAIIFLNKLLWYSRNYIPPRWYSLDKWAVHIVNGDILLAEVGGEEIADLNSSTEIVALSGLLTTHFC